MPCQPQKVYHASVYLRLSREDGEVTSGLKDESNSIANQKNLVMDYLKDKPDIRVVSVWEDDGYSGVDFNRPGFQAMMEDIRKGNTDCVIVKDLSRFGRNYIETGRYLEKLFPVLGIRFIAVNDHYDSLQTDAARDIVIPFRNLINDSYCRDLSVKIRSHLAVKRKNGEFIGAFACYGYCKDMENRNQLVPDPYAGSVVQDIFRMKLNGYSSYRIAAVLNERGILSPVEYKRSTGSRFETGFQVYSRARWSAKAVIRILTNEIYTGVLVQGKQTTPNYKIKVRQAVAEQDWVRVENTHPAVIDRRLFAIVQTLMKRDTRTSPQEEEVFPLAGLIYCGDCGQPMVRKTTVYSKKGSETETVQKYSYFVCKGQSTDGSCSWHRIRERDLTEAVLQALNFHFRGGPDRADILQTEDRTCFKQMLLHSWEKDLIRIQAEREKTEELKVSSYEDWKEGLLEQAEYRKLNAEWDLRIREICRAEEGLRKEMQNLKKSRGEWQAHFGQSRELKELTRLSAVIAVNRILVYEDRRIRIFFNFEDPFRTAPDQPADSSQGKEG